MKTSIFICDDHQLFRDGIKCIVTENGYEVIGEASNGKDLLKKLETEQPDVILLDIAMPEMDGYETAKIILENNPQQHILIISASESEKYYNDFIALGIRGYILKNSSKHELLSAIQKVSSGESYFSQSLLLNIIKNKDAQKRTNSLTRREKEVLQLICDGYSNGDISESLSISPRTVERHRANLLRKTQSPNSVKMVLSAIQKGLVTVS
ncbi:MAG: response regulator transcription factor [Bacteroidales bacterium]|jgi:DNA-binding NarL/FixJ family response regulator|nr:response regulator transcription factor [Bacteroidales bacterium]